MGSELSVYWEKYKILENSGRGRTKEVLDLEALIHQRQKEIKSKPYDFDARWARNVSNGTPTLLGPPPVENKPIEVSQNQGKLNIEQIREFLGENECAILDYCAMVADYKLTYLSHVLDKINPENANVARRGQGANMAMAERREMKLEGKGLEDINGS